MLFHGDNTSECVPLHLRGPLFKSPRNFLVNFDCLFDMAVYTGVKSVSNWWFKKRGSSRSESWPIQGVTRCRFFTIGYRFRQGVVTSGNSLVLIKEPSPLSAFGDVAKGWVYSLVCRMWTLHGREQNSEGLVRPCLVTLNSVKGYVNLTCVLPRSLW